QQSCRSSRAASARIENWCRVRCWQLLSLPASCNGEEKTEGGGRGAEKGKTWGDGRVGTRPGGEWSNGAHVRSYPGIRCANGRIRGCKCTVWREASSTLRLPVHG